MHNFLSLSLTHLHALFSYSTQSSSVNNKPIEFSKTPAANATIYHAIHDPIPKSTPFRKLFYAAGFLLTAAIVYNITTGKQVFVGYDHLFKNPTVRDNEGKV